MDGRGRVSLGKKHGCHVIEKGHEGHVVQRGQGGNTYMTEEVMNKRKEKTAKEFVEVGKKEYVWLFTSH
jgi:hypothetical protein